MEMIVDFKFAHSYSIIRVWYRTLIYSEVTSYFSDKTADSIMVATSLHSKNKIPQSFALCANIKPGSSLY